MRRFKAIIMFLDRQVEMGFPFSAALGKPLSEGLGIPLAIYTCLIICEYEEIDVVS